MNMTLFRALDKKTKTKYVYWLAITLVYSSNKSFVQRVFLTEEQAVSCSTKYNLPIITRA